MNPTNSAKFPPTVTVDAIDVVHPAQAKYQRLYEDLTILYHGGEDLRAQSTRFLVKHSKEIGTAFAFRSQTIRYDNVLGSILGWYSSKLFENELSIDFAADPATVVDEFYANFVQDVDRSDTSLEQFFEKVATEVLLYSKSHFLIDLPKLANKPSSLYEQKALGGLDPYLCHLPHGSVQNWDTDDDGNYLWVVVHTVQIQQQFLKPTLTVETWTYYDRQEYAKYQISYEEGKKPLIATLVDQGVHATASQNEVPVTCVQTDWKLWVGNRIYLDVVEYFNALNSLKWALWLAANPLPVLTDGDVSQVDLNQTVSQYAFLRLPHGGKFEWMEPEGKSYDAYQKYLEELREAIYRSSHLISQGRSSRASATVQSAVSKEADMQPAEDVLNVFGTLIRNVIQDTLQEVANIRGDGDTISPDVRGMNFSEDGASATVDLVIETKSLGIPSPLFNKELNKKVVRTVLRDANADLVQQITDQIDAAPDAEQTTFNPLGAPGANGEAAINMNITDRGTQV